MADRSVAISDTLNTLRTTYNSTAGDVGDIASLTSASGTIASSTDIVEAVVAMNTEIAALKAGTSVFETKITFEGATADAYETVLAITDPTADRTITFPDATGTVSTTTATETLTNKTLTAPTMTSPVLNTAISGSGFADEDDMSSNSATKLASQQSIKAYVDATVTAEDLDVTSDSGTIAIDLDSETLTIAGGTGLASSATSNTVTLAIDSTVATLTGSQTLTNKTLTSPTINGGTFSGSFTGTQDITGVVLSGASPLVFEGATDDGYETTLAFTDPTADRVITVPNATDTLVGKATTDTLTNKSIDLGTNTLTGSASEWNTALQGDSFATLTGSETLTNKTLTSPTLNSPTITNMTATNLTLTDSSIVFEGATADDYETTLTIVDPTADRTVYMPNATGYLPLLAAASTTTITATPAELNYSDGVTSAIQTQMDTKATKAFSIAQAVALG